jgi:hypothetical protein
MARKKPASTPEGGAETPPQPVLQPKPVSAAEVLGAAAARPAEQEPLTPAEEFAVAIDQRIIEFLNMNDYRMLPGAVQWPGLEAHMWGRRRLADAIAYYGDRIFNMDASIRRLLESKTKLPTPIDPLIERINRTHQRCGLDEAAIRNWWLQYHRDDEGPVESDAQRQAASRAARR